MAKPRVIGVNGIQFVIPKDGKSDSSGMVDKLVGAAVLLYMKFGEELREKIHGSI